MGTSKLTVNVPTEIKLEIDAMKASLHTTVSGIMLKGFELLKKEERKKRLQREAREMVDYYTNDPEVIELTETVEDIYKY